MDSKNNESDKKDWTAYYETRTIFSKECKTDSCEASWKGRSCYF